MRLAPLTGGSWLHRSVSQRLEVFRLRHSRGRGFPLLELFHAPDHIIADALSCALAANQIVYAAEPKAYPLRFVANDCINTLFAFALFSISLPLAN